MPGCAVVEKQTFMGINFMKWHIFESGKCGHHNCWMCLTLLFWGIKINSPNGRPLCWSEKLFRRNL